MSNLKINVANESVKISSLNKGLVMDMPLTSEYTKSSTIAADRSAYHAHGDAVGSATFESDGVVLNGSTNYVNVDNPTHLSFTSGGGNDLPFSVSAWVYVVDATRFPVAGKDNHGTPRREWNLTFLSTDKLWSGVYNSDGSAYRGQESDRAFTSFQNTWFHVCGTYDGSKTAGGITLYVNGEVEPSHDLTDGTYNGMTATDTAFRVGVSGAEQFFANGSTSDVKVWNRELTATEVKDLYNKGRTRQHHARISDLQKGLVLDVPLTSDWLRASDTVSDRSAYRAHLDIGGSPTVAPDGATLNGSTDYFVNNTKDYRSNDNTGTLSMWIKTTSNSNKSAFCSADDDNFYNHFFDLVITNTGRIRLLLTETGVLANDTWGTMTSLNNGKWHCVVITCNGSTKSLYVDGESDPIAVGPNNGYWLNDITSRDSITIGVRNSIPKALYFNGTISNIKLWNRALSETEILQLYREGR